MTSTSTLRAVREHGPAVAGGIDVDLPGAGVRLRATRWPGQGVPVLLLHGLASTRRFWNLVVPDLVAAGLPVVALDQRGHGESPVPDDADFSPAAVADDAATALDALGLSRAVVVGHSWGATIALTLAARHPGRVLAAVALDGGFSLRPPGTDLAAMRERLRPPELSVAPDEIEPMLRRGPLAPYWSDDVARALLPIFGVGDDGRARARLPLAQHMAVLDGILADDPEATLRSAHRPVWMVSCEPGGSFAGGLDAWSSSKAEGLAVAAKALPDARLMRWSGALHDVPLQWPALVSGLVRAACDSAAAAGPDPDDAREEAQ
jgi:pimeloyl-ACP methyl ester carboxylesterase